MKKEKIKARLWEYENFASMYTLISLLSYLLISIKIASTIWQSHFATHQDLELEINDGVQRKLIIEIHRGKQSNANVVYAPDNESSWYGSTTVHDDLDNASSDQ